MGNRDYFSGLGIFFDTYSNQNGVHAVSSFQLWPILSRVKFLLLNQNTIFLMIYSENLCP